jgi:hypothetical protein
MFGHKRQGAKDSYKLTEETVKAMYQEAFKFLTINGYGSQSRKLEELQKQVTDKEKQDLERFRTLLDRLEKQDKEIAGLKDLILFDDKPSEKLKIVRERLLEREKEETKQ